MDFSIYSPCFGPDGNPRSKNIYLLESQGSLKRLILPPSEVSPAFKAPQSQLQHVLIRFQGLGQPRDAFS